MQLALALVMVSLAGYQEPAVQPTALEDGHSRPRALAVSSDGLLFVALSTANTLAVIEAGRVRAKIPVCRFPEALAALPKGSVLVSCRFDPELLLLTPRDGGYAIERIPAGPEHGHRGLAVDAAARFAYLASPALGGVKVIDLVERKVVQTLATGLSPRALLLEGGRLYVSNFISHTVSIHPVQADGQLGASVQTLSFEAGVKDLALVGDELWLLTHEDRKLDRSHTSVEGLDSVVLKLKRSKTDPPFSDPGSGRRASQNLTEREGEPVVKLDAIAADARSQRVVIAGSASDNLWERNDGKEHVLPAGTAPAAVAFLPDGRIAVADRLSDTVSLIGPSGTESVNVGKPERSTPAELGELLFYGRALVPHNVATGGLSIYACSACHEEGHIDGRMHPAKKNRFFSMTKSCRGIATTPPYLSLGNLKTLPVFADNIVSSHAQGADAAPDSFDKYPVTLATRAAKVTLSPDEVRTALAAYMATIPPEPSPFLAPNATALSDHARAGQALFLARCARCHEAVGNTALRNKPPAAELEQRLLRQQLALAGKKLYDVGTPVLGVGGNNPPSLRGVWDAAPYFSDGSAATLEAALERTDPKSKRVHAPLPPGAQPALSEAERADLSAFLKSL
jgi:cytochrome c553